MEDSPLSITGNIVGLFTFVAAIAAFVSIRYQMLQSGYDEILSTLEAATFSFKEAGSMRHSLREHDNRPEFQQMETT